MSFLTPFLFAPLLLANGGTATSDSSTGMACRALRPMPRPDVNIELFVPEPNYELDKNLKQINRGSESDHAMWLKQNGLDSLWSHTDLQTNGDTGSGWELSYSFHAQSVPLDSFGAYYCPFILSLDMAILFRTNIRIAREFPRGTCEFDAIERHEYKHYLVNKYVMEQAVEKMRADMPHMITMLEMEGYVGREAIETRIEVMKKALSDAVSVYLKEELSRQMRDLNAQVDTPEEYDRVSKLRKICKLKEEMKRRNRPQQLQKK